MPCVEGSGPPNLVFYDRVPDLLVKMVMVPMEALSMLKHVHLIFWHTEVTVRELFRCKDVWHRK